MNVIELIRETILKEVPKEAQVTRIEFEGPEISIYVKKPEVIVEKTQIVRQIAKTIKKRVVVRTDPSIRKPKELAKKIVLEITPPEAEIKDMIFDNTLGEMLIKAKKPGLVIGKGGQLLRKILRETGWRPVVIRVPPLESKLVSQVLQHIVSESDYRLKILRQVGQRIHRSPIFKYRHVRVTALGGFMEVGRSAILVESAESKVLLDLGINPGAERNILAYPRLDIGDFRVEDLDAVVVSHAHLDHCGFVPYLFKYGYNGPVYMTKATRDLMVLLQLDFLELSKREGRSLPYGLREVKKAVLHTIPLDYGEVTDIAPDIRLTLYNAGHILGSAIIHLHIGEGLHNIVYTSDFKYSPTRLLDPANDRFPRVETLIMESTYGTEDLPPREDAEKELIAAVKETIERRGKVLIPIFSVGRGQEIMLVLIDAIKKNLLPQIPIYIEGMVDEATAIHTAYPELLSSTLKDLIYQDENPFTAEFIYRIDDREARRDIVESSEPSIILATSGMLTGGPAVEYFKLLAPNNNNSLIFVSYQVEGTLGRKIKDGIREVQFITPEGRVELVKINMNVKAIEGFSGHSDRKQLLKFLRNIRPQPNRVILCHGEKSRIMALSAAIRRRFGLEVYTPENLDSIRLA